MTVPVQRKKYDSEAHCVLQIKVKTVEIREAEATWGRSRGNILLKIQSIIALLLEWTNELNNALCLVKGIFEYKEMYLILSLAQM